MEKVMTAVIFIIACGFIKSFPGLSTQCVDNLTYVFLGLIIARCCK